MAIFQQSDIDNLLKGSTRAGIASSRFVNNAIRKSFRNKQMLRSTQEFNTDDLVVQLKQVANDALRLEKALDLLKRSDPGNKDIKNYKNLLQSLNDEKDALSKKLNQALASRDVASDVVKDIGNRKVPLRRGRSSASPASNRSTLGSSSLNLLGTAINVATYVSNKRAAKRPGGTSDLSAGRSGGGAADSAFMRQTLKVTRDTYARDKEYQEEFKKDFDKVGDNIVRRLDKIIDKLDKYKGGGGGGSSLPDIDVDLPDRGNKGNKGSKKPKVGGGRGGFLGKLGQTLITGGTIGLGLDAIDELQKDKDMRKEAAKDEVSRAYNYLKSFVSPNSNTTTTNPSTTVTPAPSVSPPTIVIPPNRNFGGMPGLPHLNTARPLSVIGGSEAAPAIRTNETDIDVKPQATVIINTKELEIKSGVGVAGGGGSPFATVGSDNSVLGGIGGGIGGGGIYSGSGAGTGAILGSRGGGGQAFTPAGMQRQTITINPFTGQPTMSLPSDAAGIGTAGGGISNPYGFAGQGTGGLSTGSMGSMAQLPGAVTSTTISSNGSPANIGQGGQYRPVYTLGQSDLSDEVVRTIAGEARMGDPKSVDAVIHTMMNRIGSSGYGPSGNLGEVAAAPGQFAGYNKGKPSAEQAEMIRSRIRDIASGKVPDITGGANEFRTEGYSGPWGQKHAADGKTIGGNTFARNPNAKGSYQSYDKPLDTTGTTAGGDSGSTGGAGTIDPKYFDQIKGTANKARDGSMGDPNSPTFKEDNLTTVQLNSGKMVQVNKAAAESFKGFLNELEGSGYSIDSLGGYNNRSNRNDPSKTSMHGYGTAIDINPAQNPNQPGQTGPGITNLPSNVSSMAAKYGLSWGGDWKSLKDTMHFEYAGQLADSLKKQTEEDRKNGSSTASMDPNKPIYDPTKTFGKPMGGTEPPSDANKSAMGSFWSQQDKPTDLKSRSLGAFVKAARDGDQAPSNNSDMAEAAGPMSLDQMNNLSPFRNEKNKPTSWYQDQDTLKWKPVFDNKPNPGMTTAAASAEGNLDGTYGANHSPALERASPDRLSRSPDKFTPNEGNMSLDEIKNYGPNANTNSSSEGSTRQSAAPPPPETSAPNPSSGGGGSGGSSGDSSKQANPSDQKAVGDGAAPTISEIPVKNDDLGLAVINSYDV